MNLQGDFEGLFLTSILQLLCNDQKTGLLRVTSGKNESRVFFERGTIVYASGSQKETRLGYIMRRHGIISQEQLQKCLALAKEQKISLGKILLDKGYVSQETLKMYNTKQVEEILYNILLWKKGKFEYKDVTLNLQGMVITQLNPMKLILEASRRVDEMSILSQVITSDKLIFKISGNVENKEEIKLNANEWGILSLIDGSRTIRQIINISGYAEFAIYKIFYSLNSYGLIEKIEEVKLGKHAGESDYSAIITVYCDILDTVNKYIQEELGSRADTLFEEAKSELPSQSKNIFQKFHPSQKNEKNIQAILESMKEIEEPEEGHDLLISGFNAYTSTILEKIAVILGQRPVMAILQEMNQVMGYVKKYHSDSAEKNMIVNDITQIIKDIEVRFKGKKKGKGFLSFLK